MPDLEDPGELFWEVESEADSMFSLAIADSTELGRQEICDALRLYFGPPGY